MHTAPCPHYPLCGGCSLQHLPDADYRTYKQAILEKILTQLGIDLATMEPFYSVGTRARRRVDFKVSYHKTKGVSVGFYEAKTHHVIDITTCLVSDDRLEALLPYLKKHLNQLRKPGIITHISVTVLDDGLDMLIYGNGNISAADKTVLASLMDQYPTIIRMYFQIQDDPSSLQRIYQSTDATITFGSTAVTLPANAFLQATAAGEQAIAQFITTHLAAYITPTTHIADLYAGCGTYSFTLLNQFPPLVIHAYEGNEPMIQALTNAARHHHFTSPPTGTIRDLVKHPLRPNELNAFDIVILNPPRNGALSQVKQLCASSVTTIVMVSCNPSTFKIDADYLLTHGFTLKACKAIDQFYWNKHLEIVALFVKA